MNTGNIKPAEYYREEYMEWMNWINKARENRKLSWDKIRLFETVNEESCQTKLKSFLDINPEAAPLTLEQWQSMIDWREQQEKNELPVTIRNRESERGSGDRSLSTSKSSAWIMYQNGLKKKGFSDASIEDIKSSNCRVYNLLEDGTSGQKDPVKGLVMGNVQSGKTANMGALMSMTADYGWNIYIVLSGTIESLRQQTQNRFVKDLRNGNITWQFLDNPRCTGTDSPSRLDLKKDNRIRYVITCLKNSTRLKKLCEWLNYDSQKKAQMRVLVIDDESDQASLNTKKMTADEEQERTAINNWLLAIVYGWKNREEKDKIIPYLAMNYVAYTATPYGNFLNECTEPCLYPRDFIVVLRAPDIYFGPAQIFGDHVNGKYPGLPIINKISGGGLSDGNYDEDTKILEAIADFDPGDSAAPEIPYSLQETVAWFCICIAIRRYQKSKKPVSMLVHHSMITKYHACIATAIKNWFTKLTKKALMNLCEQVYNEQTEKFNRETLISCYPDYGELSELVLPTDIPDYPAFAELVPFLEELKKYPMRHIVLLDDGHMQYHKGIHLCVDNCKNEIVCNDGTPDEPVVRLIYPDEQSRCDVDAPAFIVIGGNTLSRGLTLEGLVCTYFSRRVGQADSLMQMGRWFGYRRGYEMLPRIWMTKRGVKQFEYLSTLDITLREDLLKYNGDTSTPMDCGPIIQTCPEQLRLRLTAANKMQAAEAAEMNFAGAHLQSFIFQNDEALLQKNLMAADCFIKSLGDYEAGTCNENAHVWTGIPFEQIWENLLDGSAWQLGHMENLKVFHEWMEKINQKDGLPDWTVILSGRNNQEEHFWNGVGKIERSRILTGMRTANGREFSIGVLSDPNVWKADLPKTAIDGLGTEAKELLKAKKRSKEKAILQDEIRQTAGVARIPRLVLYCIDKNSKAGTNRSKGSRERCDLNAIADVIGIEIIIPGNRTEKKYCASVTIHTSNKDE